MTLMTIGSYQISVSVFQVRSVVNTLNFRVLTYHVQKCVDGALVLFDISESFGVEEVGNRLTVIRREKLDTGSYIPVVNRGSMWQDSLENIYICGGHFFSQPFEGTWGYWDLSKFFVQKKDIPDYSVWRYNIKTNEWDNLFPEIDSKYPPLARLVSAGYDSIPSMNLSYAFGYVL